MTFNSHLLYISSYEPDIYQFINDMDHVSNEVLFIKIEIINNCKFC